MYRCALVTVMVCVMDVSPAWGQDAESRNKVAIQGQEFEIYPAERLRSKGVDVPEIPHDQNAAWVYLDAINAMVDETRAALGPIDIIVNNVGIQHVAPIE